MTAALACRHLFSGGCDSLKICPSEKAMMQVKTWVLPGGTASAADLSFFRRKNILKPASTLSITSVCHPFRIFGIGLSVFYTLGLLKIVDDRRKT
jgi:hypothetical protein